VPTSDEGHTATTTTMAMPPLSPKRSGGGATEIADALQTAEGGKVSASTVAEAETTRMGANAAWEKQATPTNNELTNCHTPRSSMPPPDLPAPREKNAEAETTQVEARVASPTAETKVGFPISSPLSAPTVATVGATSTPTIGSDGGNGGVGDSDDIQQETNSNDNNGSRFGSQLSGFYSMHQVRPTLPSTTVSASTNSAAFAFHGNNDNSNNGSVSSVGDGDDGGGGGVDNDDCGSVGYMLSSAMSATQTQSRKQQRRRRQQEVQRQLSLPVRAAEAADSKVELLGHSLSISVATAAVLETTAMPRTRHKGTASHVSNVGLSNSSPLPAPAVAAVDATSTPTVGSGGGNSGGGDGDTQQESVNRVALVVSVRLILETLFAVETHVQERQRSSESAQRRYDYRNGLISSRKKRGKLVAGHSILLASKVEMVALLSSLPNLSSFSVSARAAKQSGLSSISAGGRVAAAAEEVRMRSRDSSGDAAEPNDAAGIDGGGDGRSSFSDDFTEAKGDPLYCCGLFFNSFFLSFFMRHVRLYKTQPKKTAQDTD